MENDPALTLHCVQCSDPMTIEQVLDSCQEHMRQIWNSQIFYCPKNKCSNVLDLTVPYMLSIDTRDQDDYGKKQSISVPGMGIKKINQKLRKGLLFSWKGREWFAATYVCLRAKATKKDKDSCHYEFFLESESKLKGRAPFILLGRAQLLLDRGVLLLTESCDPRAEVFWESVTMQIVSYFKNHDSPPKTLEWLASRGG